GRTDGGDLADGQLRVLQPADDRALRRVLRLADAAPALDRGTHAARFSRRGRTARVDRAPHNRSRVVPAAQHLGLVHVDALAVVATRSARPAVADRGVSFL